MSSLRPFWLGSEVNCQDLEVRGGQVDSEGRNSYFLIAFKDLQVSEENPVFNPNLGREV